MSESVQSSIGLLVNGTATIPTLDQPEETQLKIQITVALEGLYRAQEGFGVAILQRYLNLGRLLIEGKKVVPFGQFGNWLLTNFPKLERRTVSRAKAVASNWTLVSNLKPDSLNAFFRLLRIEKAKIAAVPVPASKPSKIIRACQHLEKLLKAQTVGEGMACSKAVDDIRLALRRLTKELNKVAVVDAVDVAASSNTAPASTPGGDPAAGMPPEAGMDPAAGGGDPALAGIDPAALAGAADPAAAAAGGAMPPEPMPPVAEEDPTKAASRILAEYTAKKAATAAASK